MSNEEISALSYYLTRFRCELEDFIEENVYDLPAETEKYYEEIIEKINEIMTFSRIDRGEEND